ALRLAHALRVPLPLRAPHPPRPHPQPPPFPTRRSSDLASTAYHLCKKGASTLLVETSHTGQATQAGTGVIHPWPFPWDTPADWADRKSTRLNSSHVSISYAVFCLKKKKATNTTQLATRN